jgi:hypothetical protein
VVERALRTASIVASLIVVASFAMFAVDELNGASTRQQQKLSQEIAQPNPSAAAERARERQHSAIREAIDDADDVLLAPLKGVVTSSSTWVSRGVPSLLALLVYGFGLGFLARFARGRVT